MNLIICKIFTEEAHLNEVSQVVVIFLASSNCKSGGGAIISVNDFNAFRKKRL